MLAAESVTGLQRELKMMVGNSLVLLGGSYFSGGAVETSDIDFFVIDNWLGCYRLWKKRKVIKKWEGVNTKIKINVMIVPRFFYNRGWFCISGRGLGGKRYFSKFRKDLVLRNAFKLSAFYGLKFLKSNDENWWRKAGKQLAIVDLANKGKTNFSDEIVSTDWSVERLFDIIDESVVNRFCWANYLIYNLKFLPKLDFSFLFCNPDKKVWQELSGVLKNKEIDKERLGWIEKYVFPAIII